MQTIQAIMVENIRKEFPILDLEIKGKPLAYLDNAATTQKPRQVLDCLQNYYQQQNANIHRGIYHLAAEATAAYEESRETTRKFFNAKSRKEIIFTSGTTASVNLVAQSFTTPMLEPGDEVLISAMEHHSNLIPWQIACKKKGAKLRVIPMNQAGELDLEAFQALLSPKTRMLALVHISNALGTINPIQKMIQMAKAYEIPVLIDAAQSAAYYSLDVQALDCDFLVCSSHKLFGPTGVGVLYGKEHLLKDMEPYQYGGEMIKTVRFEETTFADLPHKFEAGTPNIAGVVAFKAALDFINTLDKEQVQTHLNDLLAYGTKQLSAIPNLQIIGQAKEKSAIISFTLDNIHPHDMATFLNEYGVAVRAGHHCTQPIMDFYGIPGTSRASFSIYNTRLEVDQLVEAIHSVRAFFA